MLPRAPSARLFPGSHALPGRQFSSCPGAAPWHRSPRRPDALLCCEASPPSWTPSSYCFGTLVSSTSQFCLWLLEHREYQTYAVMWSSYDWIPSSHRWDIMTTILSSGHLPKCASAPECALPCRIFQLDAFFAGTILWVWDITDVISLQICTTNWIPPSHAMFFRSG